MSLIVMLVSLWITIIDIHLFYILISHFKNNYIHFVIVLLHTFQQPIISQFFLNQSSLSKSQYFANLFFRAQQKNNRPLIYFFSLFMISYVSILTMNIVLPFLYENIYILNCIAFNHIAIKFI